MNKKEKKPIKKKVVQKVDDLLIAIGRFMVLRQLKDLGIPDDIIKKILRDA